MSRVAFLVYAALTALALVAPRALPKGRRFRTGLAVVALLGILFKAALSVSKDVEPWFDGWDGFVYFERDFAVPFGAFFFAVASGLLDEPRNQRAVKIMPGLLLAYLALVNLWVFGTPACYTKSDGIWRQGVCIQSTDYTCGPAALATLLRAKGVKTTEHDCARESDTVPDRGVTDLGATMALRHLLPGSKVAIRRVSIDGLKDVAVPALLPLRFNFWFDHMTVLLGVEGDAFLVGDPLRGPVHMARKELEERYLGHVITVE